MQRTLRSFIKNVKEHKSIVFFWKEWMPNPALRAFPVCAWYVIPGFLYGVMEILQFLTFFGPCVLEKVEYNCNEWSA